MGREGKDGVSTLQLGNLQVLRETLSLKKKRGGGRLRKTLWLALVPTLTLSFQLVSWLQWVLSHYRLGQVDSQSELVQWNSSWGGMARHAASGHQMALHCEPGASHRPTVIFLPQRDLQQESQMPVSSHCEAVVYRALPSFK